MTFADQAVMARQDGRVTDEPAEKPARPKRSIITGRTSSLTSHPD
ncbi:hypothetical protein ACFSL4_29265 [Streptomyces caeni]|uniref:Transposase n=1 Tax=Streptomyces caeni TaxID=2307231 RepID=A0ABW4J019_9ACTN